MKKNKGKLWNPNWGRWQRYHHIYCLCSVNYHSWKSFCNDSDNYLRIISKIHKYVSYINPNSFGVLALRNKPFLAPDFRGIREVSLAARERRLSYDIIMQIKTSRKDSPPKLYGHLKLSCNALNNHNSKFSIITIFPFGIVFRCMN